MSKWSVKRPYTVIVSVILVFILGFVSFTNMTTDLLPSMDLPYLVVMTAYPGATPEKVEQSVTKPLEQQLAVVSNLNEIQSISNENYSLIILEFEEDTNMDSAMVDINNKIAQISGTFDDMVQTPTMMRLNPNMMPIMMSAVSFDGKNQQELSDLLEDELLAELQKVNGVATISTSGLFTDRVELIISQDKIDEFNGKIKRSLDQTFDEAQSKIQSAEKKLSTGEKQATDALRELREKKDFIVTSLDELNAIFDGQLMELEAQKKEVLESKQYYEESLVALDKQIEVLGKTKQQLQETLTQLQQANERLTSLRLQLEGLLNQKAILDEQIQQIQKNPDMSDDAKEYAIQAILSSQEYQSILSGLKTIDQLLQAQGMEQEDLLGLPDKVQQVQKSLIQTTNDYEDAIKKRQDLQATYDTLRPQIEYALNTIEQYEQEIEKQRTTQSLQLTEPLKAILSGENQLNQALDQINTGKKQIATAKKQLQSNKKTAYQAADISKILSKEMIANLLTAQNFSMPLGTIESTDGSRVVKVGERFQSLEELENLLLVDMEGMDPIYLKDVIEIHIVSESNSGRAIINGEDGIILSIQKQSTASTAAVANRLQAKMDDLTKEYEGLQFHTLMDQGMYIEIVIDSVLQNLLLGGLLAVVILYLFLRDYKPTLIIACSIPISLLVAIVMMYFSGITLNIISLAGLALGVGMLVDNSIVVIENIYRLRSEGYGVIQASIKGAQTVAGAIIASTLTTISVFLPIVFATGLAKQLFVDMGLTIAFSLLASLLVALAFIPMMSSRMLKKTAQPKRKMMDWLIEKYDRAIRWALKKKGIVLTMALVLFIASIALAMNQGTELLPKMDSPQMMATLTVSETSGANLEDLAIEFMDKVESVSEIETIGALFGQSDTLMGKSEQTKSISIYLVLDENKTRSNQTIAKEMQELTKDMDCDVMITSSSMDMTSVLASGVAIDIKGEQLDALKETALDLSQILSEIEGIAEVDNGLNEDDVEIRVVVDKNKAMEYGLTVAQVYMAISEDMTNEKTSSNILVENKEYPVVIIDQRQEPLTQEDLSSYTLKGTKNNKEVTVKLKDIAVIEQQQGLQSISHVSQQRTMQVTATLKDGYNIGKVSQVIEQKLKDYQTLDGIKIEMAGENEMINETLIELMKMIALAIVFIYLIMVAQFQSLLSPFIVMFTIPLAFTGGFLALWICGMNVSMIAMLGFLVLSGVVVNNGIVFVDYTNQLRLTGMEKQEALILAGKTRMRPILMTALTTILGLSTMAIGLGMGAEMLQPMGIVTIGGLIYATILTLFVVPCMYDILYRKEIHSIEEETSEV
ncbi:MAG: efflux RND transporter permease subunit [Erysipelotrichaceae bacterium]|nr:efflux RND transporter permease subunit [Erysipelotrichaceae bacterium]